MKHATESIEIKIERMISASPEAVYDAWLSPSTPGTPWNMAEKLILHPEVDGLFYWRIKEHNHYGRFTEVQRPGLIRHTWVSPNTLGLESVVTVSFAEAREGTLMTLVHSGLPDTEGGRGHENGWNYFLDIFAKRFGDEALMEAKK